MSGGWHEYRYKPFPFPGVMLGAFPFKHYEPDPNASESRYGERLFDLVVSRLDMTKLPGWSVRPRWKSLAQASRNHWGILARVLEEHGVSRRAFSERKTPKS